MKNLIKYFICFFKHKKNNREFIGDNYGTKICLECGKFWYKT